MLELISPPPEVASERKVAAEDRQLLIASRTYASEVRWKSWWHLLSTLAVLVGLVAVVALNQNMILRFASSLLIGLTLVRMFILFHDYLHQTIFKGSLVAASILHLYGHLMLTPPNVWKRNHDHHHKNNSRMFGASIGSFPIMTTFGFAESSFAKRLEYRLARSSLVIVFGYFSVFLFSMCIYPLVEDFKRSLSVFVSLFIHYGTIALSVMLMGWSFTIFAFIIPTVFAMMLGSYLFYVQHNFPAAKVQASEKWTYSDAALTASSFLDTGPIMRWFTGNIGYHHVHHLNAKIPFYRLPEAMEGLAGLQQPGCTTLALSDIWQCLRLKLWDPELSKFVSFKGARKAVRKQ